MEPCLYNTVRMNQLHTFSQTQIFLLQACTFLCNFLRLHKHKPGWLWNNENVSKFPLRRKAKADTSPGKQRRIQQSCAGMLIGTVLWRWISPIRRAERVGGIGRRGRGRHGGGRYRVAEIEAYSDDKREPYAYLTGTTNLALLSVSLYAC